MGQIYFDLATGIYYKSEDDYSDWQHKKKFRDDLKSLINETKSATEMVRNFNKSVDPAELDISSLSEQELDQIQKIVEFIKLKNEVYLKHLINKLNEV